MGLFLFGRGFHFGDLRRPLFGSRLEPQEGADRILGAADAGLGRGREHRPVDQGRMFDDCGPELVLADEAVIELKLQEQVVIPPCQALIGFAQLHRQVAQFVPGGRSGDVIHQMRLPAQLAKCVQHGLGFVG